MANFVNAFNQCCNGMAYIEDRYIRSVILNGKVGDGIIGTAFLIKILKDGRGIFATAGHVVSSYGSVPNVLDICMNYAGANNTAVKGVLVVEQIFLHDKYDVAIIVAVPAGKRMVESEGKLVEHDISAQLSKHTPLQLASNDDLDVGIDVAIIGFPEGKEYVFLDSILGPGSAKCIVPIMKHGIVSQIVPADFKPDRPKEIFLYDIETAPGMSGSPLIELNNDNYIVIGVHTNGSQTKDIGYAHFIKFVQELLDEVLTVLNIT